MFSLSQTVRTGKSGKCNCKEASGDKQAREHTDAANSYTADTAVNPRPSTSTAEPAEDKVKLGCEKEKSSERKILTGGETEAHWNSYGDPRFFWIGPQAHIQLNDGPPAYFYPIADCYALSIAFYLPGFEFAILVDRRPAHSQLRKVPLLPGYRRMAELHFDGADFYLQDLLTWNSQRERIDLPAGTAPLIQQKRNEFLRRYWSDTL